MDFLDWHSEGNMDLIFDWDDQKALQNLKKHKVSVEEASTVFHDALAFIFDDEDHSLEENREIILGIQLPIVY